MTGTENIHQALPISVWLSFAIIIIGIVSIIYSHGKWRPTVMLMLVALFAVLFADKLADYDTYLNTHFIGSYDQAGMPFLQGHPGWSLILNAWPLWLLPLIISMMVTWGFCKFFYKATQKAPLVIEPAEKPLTQNVAKQLETATIKHDLMAALQTIDKQALDNQALEFKIRQLTIEHQETIANLKRRIVTLTQNDH